MLGAVADSGTTVIADLEAGIGTLTRLSESTVDVTVVVVEPTLRSIDVGRRALAVADEQRQGRLVVVANKVADRDDEALVADAFADRTLLVVPADPAIDAADRLGVSPLDHEPQSPAIDALQRLAEVLGLPSA